MEAQSVRIAARTGRSVSSRILAPLAAAGGLLFVVLVNVGDDSIAKGGQAPPFNAPVHDYVDWISKTYGTNSFWIGRTIGLAGFFCLAMFIGSLCSRLSRAAEGSSRLPGVTLTSGLIGFVLLLGVAPLQFAVALRVDDGLDPVVAATLVQVGDFAFLLAMVPLAVMVAACGQAVLRSGALPRWIGQASRLVAIGMLAPLASLPSDAAFVAVLLFLVWTLVTSVALVIRTLRTS